MLRYIVFSFFMLGALSAAAQQELMLHTMPDLWHANSINPAFFPKDKKVAIGLPGYSLDAAHSGKLSYNDFLVKDGDRTILSFSNAISKLEQENEVFADQRIETLSLGLRFGKWAVQAGHANRLNAFIAYPRDLAEVLWNGNGPYVGQSKNLGLHMNFYDWNEWSVGISRHSERLSLGLRIKLLNGVSTFQTDADHSRATVYTDPDIYQLTLQTDYGFYSSSIINAIDTSGLGFDIDVDDVAAKLFSSNTGTAFDFGLEFRPTKKLSISASVLDMGGRINWKENAAYFRSEGTYTYNGVVFEGAGIISGTDSLDFNQQLDTLNDIFKFNKFAREYRTEMPQRLFAGATYQLNKRFQLGVSVFAQNANNVRRSGAGVSLRWQPLRWISGGIMYSVNNRSAANLGLHVALKPGPVQLYFASDHIPAVFNLRGQPAANLRMGASIVW